MSVKWQPGRVAADAAVSCGLEFDYESGVTTFDRYVMRTWKSYRELNLTRDIDRLDEFWADLGKVWLAELGFAGHESAFRAAFWDALYGPNQTVFTLYDDTIPGLTALREDNVRLAVISNWDYSLHRVLGMLGLSSFFELTVASLEEGVEKPHPDLFSLTLERLGASKEQVMHVGDNPIDDFQGAKEFGIRAAIIDRSKFAVVRPYLPSLTDIPEAFTWTS